MIPENLTMEQVVEKNPLVELGGQYRPPDCWTRHHTAVVVPYYGQNQHLRHLLFHLHPFLQRQQLHYAIYVVNQVQAEWGGPDARRQRGLSMATESGLRSPVSELTAFGPESVRGAGFMSQDKLELGGN